MEPIIWTPRLKLTLVTKAERGSPEFEWYHELRSDEKATWWSITGRSQSIADTEKNIKNILPLVEPDGTTYRVVYAVHKILEPATSPDSQNENPETRFIGLVNLWSFGKNSLQLPDALNLPASSAATTLTIEIAYSFLPAGWGVGFATESVVAVTEACKRGKAVWAPYEKLYVRALVNLENAPSQRVMAKAGFSKIGEYSVTREIFLAGEWRVNHVLFIYGKHLLE